MIHTLNDILIWIATVFNTIAILFLNKAIRMNVRNIVTNRARIILNGHATRQVMSDMEKQNEKI